MASSEKDGDSVIGEECHIIARELQGPRGDSSLPLEERDEVENLVLLCRNHHKQIDDQTNKFSVDLLTRIKANHEKWVRESLSSSEQKKKKNKLFFASRIDTGRQIWNSAIECHAYLFDVVQSQTKDEAYLLGDFVQNIQDYGDLWNTIESRDKILAQFEIDKQIKELYDQGFLVYAISRQQKLFTVNSEKSVDWVIGYVLILRKDNPIVQRKDDEVEKLMQVAEQTNDEFSNYVPVLLDASSFQII